MPSVDPSLLLRAADLWKPRQLLPATGDAVQDRPVLRSAAALRDIERRRGELVRSLLAGSWRRSPSPPSISADALARVASLLARTGSAGLAWWRLRDSTLSASAAALDLRQAYRLQTLEARRHERRIEQAIRILREASVEPIMAKGWAAAQLYPEPGLRPYGDIDLWVRASEHGAAQTALHCPVGQRCRVDLHAEFPQLDRSWDELYERSRLARVGAVDVRVLGLEDHLRLLCLHMLKHGAWRPIWLCDIGAAAESLPSDFDWEVCLRGPARRAEWVSCAIGLARELLGARPRGERPGTRLPRWLPAAVLRQWSDEEHYMVSPSMAFALRRRDRILKALRLRWPNAIQATVGLGGPFNGVPRLPFQLGECVLRTIAFARRAPELMRTGSPSV
ncbi:MAG: hypothetical protein DME07_13630 [Candidatus Rokuibacteriota bacterium]|nr:MAG: hypothetical protein DME07_13630 [Candidatus Rokubacteria bacterium]PYN56038.1 MAG: hypothetical protein DMD94_09075 [Candidatus Rokubacteria bacterium]